MTDLKPCPFCGGTAKVYRKQNHGGLDGSVVRCENCGAKGEWKQLSYTYACDYEAAEAWNRRANSEQTIDTMRAIEPEKGTWIEVGREEGALGIWYKRFKCSKCGWESALPIPRNFCPECGNKKRG